MSAQTDNEREVAADIEAATVPRPRTPQWAEQQAAFAQSKTATDPDERAYWRGVSVGYLVAFLGGSLWSLYHRQAKATRWAAPYTWEEAAKNLPRYRPIEFPGLSLYESSGILFGYKQATAERTDAAECSACDKRVLFVTDNETLATCRTHGIFCDDDCADTVCGRECAANDDRGHQLPDYAYEPEMHLSDEDMGRTDDYDAPMIEAFVRALSERAA